MIHNNIGAVLQRKGRFEEALAHYSQAIEAQPDYADALVNLAYVFLERRETSRALEVLDRAIVMHPDRADVHTGRGDAFLQQGSEERAIESYEQALARAPEALLPLNNLAWLFATSGQERIRNGRRAVELAERALGLAGGKDPLFLYRLAAAQAENGDFPRAIVTAERALTFASEEGNEALVAELQRNILSYRNGTPLRYSTRPN